MALRTSSKVRLAPWPGDGTQSQIAAISKIRRVVPNIEDDERACELGELAAALVEKYAPLAPDSCKSEAVIRFAGYIAQSSSFGAIRKGGVGPLSVEYVVNHSSAFRNCGAAALLSRWKIRRAGALE